jgi:hypothetical protein
LDQLGSSNDSSEVLAPRKVDTSIPSSPGIPPIPDANVAVKSFLIELEKYEPEGWQKQQKRLKEQRASWEASLPTNFNSHSNHVTPGHTLEYINQGTPTPKKKKEYFNVSTKHKRRKSNSSQ